MAAPRLEAEAELIGRYRLVRLIARGGMAEVWEAFDLVLSRAVAVKVLQPRLAVDEGLRERFRREAIAAARLSHPNIVATFDTATDETMSLSFIVMELVRGQNLRDELDTGVPFSAARAARVADGVAAALEHAHRAGVVHRDVKPGNILLVDGRAAVKVADFGIAKAAFAERQDELTSPGMIVGTAKYLSPEQARGEEPDARSDLYSLGVVLYEMVCGRPPFAGDTDVAVAYAHLHQDPPRPRDVRAGVSREVEQVVMRTLEKDPLRRYQSAAELRQALAPLAADDDAVPLVVRDPTPPAGVPAPFPRSERSWILTAGVIVIAGVALTVAGVAFSRSEIGRGLVDQVRRQPEAQELPIVEAHSFDPPPDGDGTEDESEVPAVTDGDPATTWSSDRYNTRDFGGLKAGVGVWVRLDARYTLTRLRVASPANGWSATAYVADDAASTLAGWGEPVGSVERVRGDADIDLHDSEGRVVLLWFTDPGSGNQAAVGELDVEGR